MPTTLIILSVTEDGKSRSANVEMNGDSVAEKLKEAGPLVKLPTSNGKHVYVNTAHVVMARDTTDDPPPSFASLH